ncbi:MAG: HAMP domain-containing histidine kinase [Bacteroidetes bacterium]|nr:HAMP domain-containing histidine kinase [Bacteroidota bacterium]
MKAYRLSVNLKLGLIVFAVLIAVVSLAYTNQLVHRLRERESAGMQIWAGASEQIAIIPDNPHEEGFRRLAGFLRQLQAVERGGSALLPTDGELEAYQEAVAWVYTMPPGDQINFFLEIISRYYNDIPAIITDSLRRPLAWRNISVPDSLPVSSEDTLWVVRRAKQMAEVYAPIPIELEYSQGKLKQFVYYDESALVKELRVYPYLQLLFVGLFVLVGYLGFSYVRRSEQSSLWVGMAREAAHQLGTPISSLMGWLELLRQPDMATEARDEALVEVEKDIERLSRVTHRFNDIGSMPRLEAMPLAPFISNTADYIRRRFPQKGQHVSLRVEVPDGLQAPLNAELFEWVIENLLKNALDAIEKPEGLITISAHQENGRIFIDVSDNGKGIDRRQWKNVFRPGYSTKKRGWGLGLSLAKRIVEDYHGGSLTLAQSKVGQGSTFRIELPAAGRERVKRVKRV